MYLQNINSRSIKYVSRLVQEESLIQAVYFFSIEVQQNELEIFLNCLYLNLDLTRYKPVKGFVEQITHAKLYYTFCSASAKTKIPGSKIYVF